MVCDTDLQPVTHESSQQPHTYRRVVFSVLLTLVLLVQYRMASRLGLNLLFHMINTANPLFMTVGTIGLPGGIIIKTPFSSSLVRFLFCWTRFLAVWKSCWLHPGSEAFVSCTCAKGLRPHCGLSTPFRYWLSAGSRRPWPFPLCLVLLVPALDTAFSEAVRLPVLSAKMLAGVCVPP